MAEGAGHIFDFRFTTTEGKRLLAAVKPAALVAVSGINRIVELVAEQILPSVVDFLVLITEEKLSRVDLFNVQVVNMALYLHTKSRYLDT
jgi:hypothetical protein